MNQHQGDFCVKKMKEYLFGAVVCDNVNINIQHVDQVAITLFLCK